MNLNKIYSELLLNIGFSANYIQKNWLDLEKAYSGKSRYYHNLTHIAAMSESFETYRDKLDKPNEILFSIFYHDYIYKSSKKDNELKSAEFALSILHENISFDHQLVFDAIYATQQHQYNRF